LFSTWPTCGGGGGGGNSSGRPDWPTRRLQEELDLVRALNAGVSALLLEANRAARSDW